MCGNPHLFCCLLAVLLPYSLAQPVIQGAALEVGSSNSSGAVAIGLTLEADPILLSHGLYQAITVGNVTKVRMWLALGLDANMADVDDPDDRETPLMRAAAYDRPEIVGLLLQHGGDARTTNFEGKTALMIAASLGNVQAMRMLFLHTPYSSNSSAVISKGSSRKEEDAQDRHGKTALIWAAYMGKTESILELIKRHVDLELADESGRTPLMWAVTAASADDGRKAVHALLENGASPSTKDRVGATAINWAIERGRKDILEILAKYEYGMDTELVSTSGI